MMRILLLPSGYPPVLGGVQTVTHGLAQELRKRGHRVWVLTNRYPRHLPRREVLDDVPVERVLFLYPRLAQFRAGRSDVFLAGWFYFPWALKQILWRIRRFRPDVVNLHFAGGMCLFVLIAARLFSFRFVVSLHGDDVEGLERGTRFDRWLFRAILRRADAVTACSRYLLEEAAQWEPGIIGKGTVIHNAVELSSFLALDGDRPLVAPYVLAVGRLVPVRGFDVLLRAFATISAEFLGLHLVILGEGPEEQYLWQEVQKLGLDGRVVFSGRVVHYQVSRWMADSQAVIVPSLREAFGLVALEGMAAGKPIVATTVGGLPEVLDGAEAKLVPPENEEALATALRETLQTIATNPAYGQRNRELAARYGWERLVEAYLRTYGVEEG
jgi:glycosyltransferase involved in cell wall biosynthesis